MQEQVTRAVKCDKKISLVAPVHKTLSWSVSVYDQDVSPLSYLLVEFTLTPGPAPPPPTHSDKWTVM